MKRHQIGHFSKLLQAIKYLLQGRLTKCPMTLSLGRTYVWWCPMTFSSVWLGNKSEWRKLISAQCIYSGLNENISGSFLYNTLILHYNIPASSTRVHFDLRTWRKRRTNLQFGRTSIHLGWTNNKSQFHFGRTECLVVSSLRRTIWRLGRTMSVTDRYFKACVVADMSRPHFHIVDKLGIFCKHINCWFG
jgi:hypothetical protein